MCKKSTNDKGTKKDFYFQDRKRVRVEDRKKFMENNMDIAGRKLGKKVPWMKKGRRGWTSTEVFSKKKKGIGGRAMTKGEKGTWPDFSARAVHGMRD